MTKYLDSAAFSSKPITPEYANGWDIAFGTWGVWCVEDARWCDGTIGKYPHAEAELARWQSGAVASVEPGQFHYELRKVEP